MAERENPCFTHDRRLRLWPFTDLLAAAVSGPTLHFGDALRLCNRWHTDDNEFYGLFSMSVLLNIEPIASLLLGIILLDPMRTPGPLSWQARLSFTLFAQRKGRATAQKNAVKPVSSLFAAETG
jgi:hypothetical protein